MRLREYDRPFDVAVTVLGNAFEDPDLPRAALFGRIGADAFCVVVADDGKLEYLLDRGGAPGDLNLDLMRRDLGVLARYALQRLVAEPASRLWNGLFRSTVWAATTPLCTTFITGTWHGAAFDCAGALPAGPASALLAGSSAGRTEGPARTLAALIPHDRALTTALARAIADPTDRAALDAAAGDLAPTELTVAAVAAGLVGADIEADVTVDRVATAGIWPAGTSSAVHVTPLWWNDLDWYLLPAPRRRGL
ncbi:hypothetical protein [Paractinoplanes rishiriensis]|uniref:Uncharacterized protein n=1 Tax=Paractinoplanes rishiriensis TaxID=1050105 RepID=A0A919MZT9_9ACTN|nr:hypothetical protein [Actinoplanes rishiriensis]GIE98750.1 hypothetical protein Ari01nite_62150 [Actinoplanes rishiriensis]